jgi:hypothetical protein
MGQIVQLAAMIAIFGLVVEPVAAQTCPQIDNYNPCDGITLSQLNELLAGSGASVRDHDIVFPDGFALAVAPEETVCQVRKCDDTPNENLWIVDLFYAPDNAEPRNRMIARWQFWTDNGAGAMMDEMNRNATGTRHWYRLDQRGLMLANEF